MGAAMEETMKLLGIALIAALLLSISIARADSYSLQMAAAEVSQSLPKPPIQIQPQIAMVCFYDSQTTSGMNKICYYDCVGSLAAITLGFADICPMSINR
jgi:hypothetical protein